MSPDSRARVVLLAGMLVLVGGSALLLSSCEPAPRRERIPEAVSIPSEGPALRIQISGKSHRVRLPSAWTARDPKGGEPFAQGGPLEGEVGFEQGFRIGIQHFGRAAVRLSCAGGVVEVNGASYAGELLLQKHKGVLMVLNVLPLERYLAGVLGSEVPLDWPEEALKAQAVAARTYALVRKSWSAGEPYDLTDGVMDQCYQGLVQERPVSRRVVEATAGEVLTYGRKPFPTFYSSVCGGHTAHGPNALLEKSPWIAPLLGRPCPYCEKGLPEEKRTRFRWERMLPKAPLEKALQVPGSLLAVESISPDAGGHAGRVRLVWSPAGSRELTMVDFRKASGISSSAWTAEVLPDGVRFRGRGFGHGVGLCQWGTRRMGQEGFDHREILRFYYPGSELERLY